VKASPDSSAAMLRNAKRLSHRRKRFCRGGTPYCSATALRGAIAIHPARQPLRSARRLIMQAIFGMF
jgi:hypothetical protein